MSTPSQFILVAVPAPSAPLPPAPATVDDGSVFQCRRHGNRMPCPRVACEIATSENGDVITVRGNGVYRKPELSTFEKYVRYTCFRQQKFDTCKCGEAKCACLALECHRHNWPDEFLRFQRYVQECRCGQQPAPLYCRGEKVDILYTYGTDSAWIQGTINKIEWVRASEYELESSYHYFIKDHKQRSSWYKEGDVAPLNTKFQGLHPNGCDCLTCYSDDSD